jgi:hypothetical protein
MTILQNFAGTLESRLRAREFQLLFLAALSLLILVAVPWILSGAWVNAWELVQAYVLVLYLARPLPVLSLVFCLLGLVGVGDGLRVRRSVSRDKAEAGALDPSVIARIPEAEFQALLVRQELTPSEPSGSEKLVISGIYRTARKFFIRSVWFSAALWFLLGFLLTPLVLLLPLVKLAQEIPQPEEPTPRVGWSRPGNTEETASARDKY